MYPFLCCPTAVDSRRLLSGKLGGEIYSINLANGGEVIEYNPGYALPDDVRQLAEETIAGIIDGSISTGG